MLKIYAGFGVPSLEHFQPYDALQQLLYFGVVFILAPLMIITGPVMSPAVAGRFPWYAKLLGGRQAARSLHFIGMALFTAFTVLHVALVFIVHPEHNLTQMVLGEADPARFAQALTMTLIGIAAVVAVWLAASYWSLTDIRRTQVLLDRATEPLRRMTVNHMESRQRSRQVWTDKDISPYHWSNGRHPVGDESPEWEQLRRDDWKDYRLEIGGLVDRPVSLSLDDLRALPQQEQITLHTCMQGWTGIAKWTGVRLSDVLALVEKKPGARYVKLTSFGLAQKMHGGKPLEPYYTCLPPEMADEDETILAFEMNDKPLPLTFGAPVRLRVESIHGYKMIKYLRSIEWIEDYRTEGDGRAEPGRTPPISPSTPGSDPGRDHSGTSPVHGCRSGDCGNTGSVRGTGGPVPATGRGRPLSWPAQATMASADGPSRRSVRRVSGR
ncbi:molybdopterin-dependent oxidoreductase [Streptomyces albus]|uniref:molybdopterin-dependent oxidoreductase n=1 Tax=Streptomyces albus TaxID=1888 RepID=UPI00068FBB9A|nr:molybdopterin-dependent oxidoreductase [Streptomyces albus]